MQRWSNNGCLRYWYRRIVRNTRTRWTTHQTPSLRFIMGRIIAGIALYYLCRMEPFATLYINLHGGRFEIPDRTFYSILNAWELSMNNMGDVKELIPECFYFPEFLRNINKFLFGNRTGKENESINNVELPLWCHRSPEEFVRIMREALESEYVSSNLHHWIDLIFGYKQRGFLLFDLCRDSRPRQDQWPDH